MAWLRLAVATAFVLNSGCSEAATEAGAVPPPPPAPIPPPTIVPLTVSPSVLTLTPTGEATLVVTVRLPAGAPRQRLQYGVSGAAFAALEITSDTTALIRGVSPGTGIIFVTATSSPVGTPPDPNDPRLTVPFTVTGSIDRLGLDFSAHQFTLIPPGTFLMGQAGVATPVREVTISRPFLLQRTEVTRAQWRTVMQGTPLENRQYWTSCPTTCPVDSLTWNDVQTFLARLNEQDPGKGYRLPTEAEWEYAARAGTSGDFGTSGPVCSFAWVAEDRCAMRRPWPVGLRTPNAWGLHDMHGNVWEFVADCWRAYPATPETDPLRLDCPEPSGPVLRGGSWYYPTRFARSATRVSGTPVVNGAYGVGLRLARTP